MRYRLLLLAFAFVSCSKGTEPPSGCEPEPAPRTLIAYLCGDNNLSAEVDIKIMALRQGMERIGRTDANLIVYADYRDCMPELIRITHEGRATVRRFAELNSASPENFRQRLEDIVKEYPAESYGLICFSHASGWLPQGALNDPEGFSRQVPRVASTTRTVFEDGGNEMSLADFAAALPLPNGRKFDFIVMEACFMAGVEVAYELKDKTECIVASSAEILSDGFVEVYPEGVSMLMCGEPDPAGFARKYYDVWNAKSGAYRSATVSVINTRHLDGLAASVREICCNGRQVDAWAVQHFNRHNYHLFFDLADVVEYLATADQMARFEEAMGEVVEYAAATPAFMSGESHSFAIRRHCGLTTYLLQECFPALNARYMDTGWYKAVR